MIRPSRRPLNPFLTKVRPLMDALEDLADDTLIGILKGPAENCLINKVDDGWMDDEVDDCALPSVTERRGWDEPMEAGNILDLGLLRLVIRSGLGSRSSDLRLSQLL